MLIGFLRMLAILLAIFLGMRLIRLYLLPLLFRKAASKMQENMESRMRDFQAQRDDRQEGDVRVERKAKPGSADRVDDGDYVDFEEVD